MLHHLVVLSLPDRPSGILPEVIKFFSSLIVLLDSSFLARQAVHKPLVRLLRGCVGDEAGSEDFLDQDQDSLSIDEDSESEARGNFSKIGTKEALIYEPDLVDLMCHIAGRVRADPGLLLIFFQPQVNSMTLNRSQSSTSDLDRPLSPTNSDTASVDTLQPSKPSTSLAPSALEPNFGIRDQSQFEPDAFPLFAYLLRFAHREGRVGDLARAGLGFVMDVAFGFGSSSSSESNAEEVGSLSARSSLSSYILHSDFSDVLGAGLGAVYGLLPTKLAILRPSTETQSDSEDPSSTAAAGVSMLGGGMSLGAGGGTGSSNSGLESEGIDELEKLEELGIEPSTSKGLKEQIDLLVGMLEFAQTITKKAKIASFQSDQDEDEETVLPSDSNYELQRFKSEISNNVKELLIKISSSVKNLFLQNVLYPSLLECSNLDGSAIAVMSYLDVVLDVLKGEGEGEGEGVLAEVVLRYLAGWDEMEMEESFEKAVNSSGIISLDSTDYSSNNEKVPDSPTTIKKNRRKSTALLSLEDSQESKAKSRGNEIPYFTEALGRYTIQDLIGDNLELTANQSDSSSSTTTPSTQVNTPSSTVNQACAAAALRLARTLIVRHGRFTTKALMKVQSKEGATAFPWPFSPMTQDDDLEKKGQEDDVKEDQNDNKEDSDDEFVYPGMTSEKGDNPWSTVPSSGPLKLSTTSKSQSRSSSRAQTPQVSSISLEQHLLELDIFFSLINSIDPSRSKSSKLDGSDSSSMSTTTGYENYLLDAEEALSNESTYKEGTRVLEEGMNNADSNLIPSRSSNRGGGGGRLVRKRSSSSSLGRSSSLNRGRGLTKSSSDRSLSSSISILSKKRLERLKQDPFRSQLSHHQFSPSDPFLRSLLNAMSHFFEHSPELNVALTGTLSSLALCPYRSLEGWLVFQKPPQSSTTEEKKTQEEEGIDEDHYSEDDSIDEKLRNASLWSAGQRRKKKNSSKTSPLSGSPVPIVLSLLKSLAKQVEKYRSEIKNFDSFLAERRRGLMFVENLNDALGLDSIAGEEDEQDGEGIKNGNGDGPSLCVPEISHLETEEYWKELGIQMEEEDEKSQEEEDSKVIYIPPPSPSTLIPSSTHTDITQSGTKSEPKDNSSTSTPKREGFARFFGRPPKSTEKEKEKEKVSTTTTTTTIVTPFAQHYSQTASIIVKPRIASLPKGDWTSSIDPIPSTESIDGESSEINLEPEEEEVKPKKRTRFLEDSSNGKGKGRKSEDGFTYPGDESDEEEDEKVEEKKKYDGPTVTLSSVLDNIVILEEAIKELVAIIQIRRNFGIDAVRFV